MVVPVVCWCDVVRISATVFQLQTMEIRAAAASQLGDENSVQNPTQWKNFNPISLKAEKREIDKIISFDFEWVCVGSTQTSQMDRCSTCSSTFAIIVAFPISRKFPIDVVLT